MLLCQVFSSCIPEDQGSGSPRHAGVNIPHGICVYVCMRAYACTWIIFVLPSEERKMHAHTQIFMTLGFPASGSLFGVMSLQDRLFLE